MFWRYNALTSHIDTLLDNENVTLHQLMDEDDILQECKGQNHKLLEFLVTPDVMSQLVDMITCEPTGDVEDKVKYKYPNIACELLTSDVAQILDKLTEDNILIDRVYAFLTSSDHLNPLLASFFTKVMCLLLMRKADYLFEYLHSKEDFLGHLLAHIGTSAIMDLLMRLITYDPIYETKSRILEWMDQESVVSKLVDLIHPDQEEEMHFNASITLCDIVRYGREQQGAETPQADPLLDKVESEPILTRLLSNMLDGATCESAITNGLNVLQTVLEYKRQISLFDDWKPMPEGCSDPLPQQELDRMEQAVNTVITCVKPRLNELTDLLTNPPQQKYSMMTTTVGVLEPPLGNTRLQVSRLFSCLFAVNQTELHEKLAEFQVINRLLDLFFKYMWNNFLHTQVEQCIDNILQCCGEETEQIEAHTPLVNHLFKDCQITRKVLNAWNENEESIKQGQHRHGYMGHLTKIANDLVTAAEVGPLTSLVSSLLKELPDEEQTLWNEFATTHLPDVNKKNTSELVGTHPLNSSSGSDSDIDFNNIPFPQDDRAQQVFSDYQLQQMTSNFIDQFVLNEEEFVEPNGRIDAVFTQQISALDWATTANDATPKMFDDICQMKVTQFDGNSSDEEDEDDPWKDKEVTFGATKPLTNTTSSVSSTARADSDSNSSDEELSSPRVIVSKLSGEQDIAMDVDQPLSASDEPAIPVAMDTSSPWGTETTTEAADNEEWSAFEGVNDASGDDGWADFSSIDQKPTTTDGGPRVSSPDQLMEPSSTPQNPPNASQSQDEKSEELPTVGSDPSIPTVVKEAGNSVGDDEEGLEADLNTGDNSKDSSSSGDSSEATPSDANPECSSLKKVAVTPEAASNDSTEPIVASNDSTEPVVEIQSVTNNSVPKACNGPETLKTENTKDKPIEQEVNGPSS